MSEGDEYGLVDITIVVPGRIEYLTDGGNWKRVTQPLQRGDRWWYSKRVAADFLYGSYRLLQLFSLYSSL